MINFIMSICDHSGNRVVFVMRIFQGHVGIVRFVRGPGAGGLKRWQKIGQNSFTTQKLGNDADLLFYRASSLYARDAKELHR